MTLAWFQCLSGASGDMLLGALLDAGAPLDRVQAAVDAIGTETVEVGVEPAVRGGLAATWARVRTSSSPVVRTWGNLRGLIEAADLPEPVRLRVLDVFARLAEAEARAHRTKPEQVHFHEVGALDAVADVVGVCTALDLLGVTEASASSVAVGHGMVRSSHGMLPVPGPAVVALLSDVGAPVHSGDEPYELCTPTGAALLAATVTRWGGPPSGRIIGSGHGAGSRELDRMPNVLRVLLFEPVADDAGAGATPVATGVAASEGTFAGPAEAQLVLEANVDDLDPRLWPPVLSRLLDAGASDAWLTPILMKKGRPAHTLSVLVEPRLADAVRRVVFAETSSIGLREHLVAKRALERGWVTVAVGGQEVRVKTASLDGLVVNAQPEYDDVAAVAASTGRPVKSVLAEAVAAAHRAGLTG